MQDRVLKSKLVRAGRRQSDIARQLAVSVNAVSLVVRGLSRSRRIEKAIAEAIGAKPQQIFPITPSPLVTRAKVAPHG